MFRAPSLISALPIHKPLLPEQCCMGLASESCLAPQPCALPGMNASCNPASSLLEEPGRAWWSWECLQEILREC